MEYFLERWTLREAYVKALGIGISFPVRKLCFDIQPGTDIRMRFQPDIEERAAHWKFRLFRPTARHILSVALRSGSKPAPEISMHRTDKMGVGKNLL